MPIVKHSVDGTITLSDGTAGTPLSLVIAYEEGNFSLGPLSKDQKEISKYYDRGSLCSARATQDTHPQVSFSAYMVDVHDGTAVTLVDFLNAGTAGASSCVTTYANGDIFTIDIVWTIAEPGAAAHTITCPEVACTISLEEGDPNTISITGEVLGTIAMT